MTTLVIGFGPFLTVTDNPARRLALAVDGALNGHVLGREMPVSYERSVQVTLGYIQRLGPTRVLGIGVARHRAGPELEQIARRRVSPTLDVDGTRGPLTGPDERRATFPNALSTALGAACSTDAGDYVCNGWLYAMLGCCALPVGFLHIPPAGIPAQRLIEALAHISRPPLT
jgi:pyrrolidone-carboxylate peptidase